jgi:putative hydrolase of the HAD superfamily
MSSVRVVLFDVVGTLIAPRPAAPEAYQSIGSCYGIQMTNEEAAARFSQAFRHHTQDSDAPTSEEHERDRWRRIVSEVLPAADDQAEAIFSALWRHFSNAANWAIYDDAEPTWKALRDRGLTVGLASNFDSRLEAICSSIEWLADCRHVYYSSKVGFSKPNRRFFEAIERRLGVCGEQILLVGDDLANDFEGASAAGWKALWLDRRGLAKADSLRDERIGNLRELPKLFALSKDCRI